MRKVAVVTVARSDYGLYRPILDEIDRQDDVEAALVVAGAHLSEAFGRTVDAIEDDGREIAARVPTTGMDDTPAAVALAAARAAHGLADALPAIAPDLLLVLGDRYEMHAAAVVAAPLRIPVGHVHGGELTEGAIDDLLRHSITKLSHLHFAATAEAAERIVQMGEEPWRVTVSGAPGLDAIRALRPLDDGEAERLLGLPLDRPFALVAYHPATLVADEDPAATADAILDAVAAAGLPAVCTYPGADAGSRGIVAALEARAERAPAQVVLAPSLGSRAWLTLLSRAAVLVGNSSSGIIEAASYALPVVNVGDRQRGRERAANVLDVAGDRAAIDAALARALDPGFRRSLDGLVNPYGDGRAAQRVVDRLRSVPLDARLLAKRFHRVGAQP